MPRLARRWAPSWFSVLLGQSPGKSGEMARFYVSIKGADLERAMLALDVVNVPTVAVTEANYGDVPPADGKLHALTAVLDADSGEAAQGQVRKVLPAGYQIRLRAPLDPI